MKKILVLILILSCFYLAGCSTPARMAHPEIYSITRQEKKIKGTFSNKKEIIIKDFRGNDRYEEDITSLKEEAEKYIISHEGLSEARKSDLRELRVSVGQSREEVKLLLGKPDKVSKDIWIYKINKMRAFTVFIIPVFFVHESYGLYFKEDVLVGIERHYLNQVVQQSPALGVFGREEKSDSK